MKLKDAQDIYADHSRAASASARQLALAGVALIWILAAELTNVDKPLLRAPTLAFVIALAADLLQYYGAAVMWGLFARVKEINDADEFDGAPPWINWPAIVGFWLKGICVAIGYAYLLGLLWPMLFRE